MSKYYSLVTIFFLIAAIIMAGGGCGQPGLRDGDNGSSDGKHGELHSDHEDSIEGRLILDELENEIGELLDLLDQLDDFDESELDE